jgi:1-acyl-sn-glycerol-3-phosphate acyltransferase
VDGTSPPKPVLQQPLAPSRWRIPYPRRRAARALVRTLGRLLIPVLFKLSISGKENFPRRGPLLVVGNHTAAMEAVLMAVFSPWQIEMLSAADMPAERITEMVADLYGVIPIHRGAYDRAALEAALDVLGQGGIIGLFPEGGIWEEGRKKALPGIAWLSFHSGAAVLPIGFSDTTGVINAGLKLKRPSLTMKVGKAQPPISIPSGGNKKAALQDYASRIMEEVQALVPSGEGAAEPEIKGESFQLAIGLRDGEGNHLEIPPHLEISHPAALAKFLHRPAILKIFIVNLGLPVDPLQQLHNQPTVAALAAALEAVVDYLENQNPYLLTYRFGIREGLAMQAGIKELQCLVDWCRSTGCQMEITPIRRYDSPHDGREILQRVQSRFQSWM